MHEVVLDGRLREVLPWHTKVFRGRRAMSKWSADLEDLRLRVHHMAEQPYGALLEVSRLDKLIHTARQAMLNAMPFEPCPKCRPDTEWCKECQNLRWIPDPLAKRNS